jgi:hypothetical protein
MDKRAIAAAVVARHRRAYESDPPDYLNLLTTGAELDAFEESDFVELDAIEAAWRRRHKARPKATRRWLVVVQGGLGYVLDAYSDELAGYRRELGDALRSEHASRGAATNALRQAMSAEGHKRPQRAHPRIRNREDR